MSQNIRLSLPVMPDPPRDGQYSLSWANNIVRAWRIFTEIYGNPGDGRMTTLVLTDLQEGGYNLEAGSLFRLGNDVKIVNQGDAFTQGSSVAVAIGTVTVSTS